MTIEWKRPNKNALTWNGYTVTPAQISTGWLYGAYRPDGTMIGKPQHFEADCQVLCEIDYKRLKAGDEVEL